MNNSLINMSEYQKVIFVNGIDETQIPESINGMSNLSSNYPFVVFFTNNGSDSNINNIWNAGKRLTRFIDVDDSHNTLTIDNHSFKLLFDYESGKLGIYEAHPLKSLRYIKCSYNSISGELVENENSLTNNYTIDAVDNKFTLTFEFEAGLTDDNSHINPANIDVTQIQKTLRFYQDSTITNNFTVTETIEQDSIESLTELPKIQKCNYKCNILKDTTSDMSFQYTAVSIYNNNVSTNDVNLKLVLNPIEYYVEWNGIILPKNIPSNLIEPNKQYTFTLKFSPNITSSETRKYYASISSSNPDCINIDSMRNKKEIISSQVSFTFNILNVPHNTEISPILTFTISREDGSNVHIYNNLTEEYTINLKGETSYKYYYYGFKDPTSNEFTFDDLKTFDYVSDDKIGSVVLYDWEDSNTQQELGNSNDPFYFAIPVAYNNRIKIRWDGYECDPYDENVQYYLSDEWNYEPVISNFDINGIKFNIYRVGNGIYHGKLQ